jgi:hypothetical protein
MAARGYAAPAEVPPLPGVAPPGYPVPPGAGVGPAPGGPPPVPAPPVYDPHGVGAAAGRLSSGARRAGRAALAVLGAVLDDGDFVAVAVQGRFRGEPGVAALVGAKVVLVNERKWKPDVVVLPLGSDLQVHGWQDDRAASLTFVAGNRHEAIDRIGDRGLAIEFAQRARHHVAAGGDLPPSAPSTPPPPPASPPPVVPG